jgi:two-component system, chemotaxis family, CheB/CheR fusion protein
VPRNEFERAALSWTDRNLTGVAPMIAADAEKELAGRKVLVVEDEMLVAIDYCQHLAEAGAEIVGPFTSVSEALKGLDTAHFDFAVLDYALADQTSDDLQAALERRDIPFVVITGYPRVLVRRTDRQQIMTKPISPEALLETIKAACR